MSENLSQIQIRELLFFGKETQSSLDKKGFAEVSQLLIRKFEEEIKNQLNEVGLVFVSGEIELVADGEIKTSPVAYMFDPLRVEAEVLPSDEEDFDEIFPQVLRLTAEGWPLFYTDEEGAVLLKPTTLPERKIA